MKMETVSRSSLGYLIGVALATVLVCGLAGCASPVSFSATRYLDSLESSHRLDSKADELCTQQAGTPVKKPIVAADGTLSLVRRLEEPGFAARQKDPILTTNQQGYAAICLFDTTNFGQPVKLWVYAVPGRGGGTIEPG
jgi:hypothetical protein